MGVAVRGIGNLARSGPSVVSGIQKEKEKETHIKNYYEQLFN